MNKEDLYSIFIYILMAVIVLVTGFVVIQPAMEAGYLATGANSQGMNFLFLLVSLVVAILINVFLLEFGHLLGAKFGGYEVLSFNILGFNFYKRKIDENNYKTSFRFKSFDGFTGETIIEPKNEKSNPMFYVFTPLVLLSLDFVALFLVFNLIPSDRETAKVLLYIKYGVIVLASIGACFIVYDYFPGRIDSLNDGYRLVLLNKKVNVSAYNLKLEMSADDFYQREHKTLNKFDIITDFTANVNLEIALEKYEKGEIEEALSIIDYTLEDPKKISTSTKTELCLTKSYLYFLTKDIEEAKTYYNETFTSEIKSKIQACKSYASIRTYILYAGLVEKSRSEIEFALQRKKKCDGKTYDGEAIKEGKYIKIALNKVYEVYPNLNKDKKVVEEKEIKEDKKEPSKEE